MNLGALVSETRNPATMGLDEMSTLEMVSCTSENFSTEGVGLGWLLM